MDYQTFFEQYEIDYTRSLDQKGLGNVYTAVDKHSDKTVAVKSIELHPMFDKGEIKARYETAKSISHPNLLPYIAIHRFPSDESIQHFVVMPYIEGGNWQEQLPKLSLKQKTELLASVLDALTFLHQQGIVWQNLRSDHLLIQNIQDIGVPLCINYGDRAALSKAYFSNYEYLAPEQLNETPLDAIDPRIDIWAFGVLAFETFTGQLPFGKKSPQTPNRRIAERILGDDLPLAVDDLPGHYKHIVRKCLQKQAEDRWQNIAEIKEFLAGPLPKSESQSKEAGILETLEKMGEDYVVPAKETGVLGFFDRKIKRKPSRPVQLWEPILWIGLAILVGYLLSNL